MINDSMKKSAVGLSFIVHLSLFLLNAAFSDALVFCTLLVSVTSELGDSQGSPCQTSLCSWKFHPSQSSACGGKESKVESPFQLYRGERGGRAQKKAIDFFVGAVSMWYVLFFLVVIIFFVNIPF